MNADGRRPLLHGTLGAVSAAHPLAVGAGIAALARGGNAVDAAIAAQAVLAVVLPHACGLGGDAMVLVAEPVAAIAADEAGPDEAGPVDDGGAVGHRVTAINGSGATPAGFDAAGWQPSGGPSVTVPGLVDAWGELSRRWGRLGLADCLGDAVRLAEGGLPLDPGVADAAQAQRHRLTAGGAGGWAMATTAAGQRARQPELAALLRLIGDDGPAGFYRGPAAAHLAAAVRRHGGHLDVDDLAAHTSVTAEPIIVECAGRRIAVQPPASQGVLLAMALRWLERHAIDQRWGPARLDHVAIELTEAVFRHRHRCARGAALFDEPLDIDLDRARHRGGPRAYLHTAGVATADGEGMVVSSLVSVFDDFGSAVFVPELGIVVNNRAGSFTEAPNDAAPAKRPIHTLAPALVLDGTSAWALATPGADGQIQTLLQVLVRRLLLGVDLAAAIAAPRWRSEDGSVLIEADHPSAGELAGRGHRLAPRPAGADVFGAVVAAGFDATTPSAGGDWRRQVWAGVI